MICLVAGVRVWTIPHACSQFRNDCTIAFPTTELFACTLVEYLKEYVWKKARIKTTEEVKEVTCILLFYQITQYIIE